MTSIAAATFAYLGFLLIVVALLIRSYYQGKPKGETMNNRNAVKRDVDTAASDLGHKLKPFRERIRGEIYDTECEKCGAFTAVVLRYDNSEWITTQKPGDRIANQCTK